MNEHFFLFHGNKLLKEKRIGFVTGRHHIRSDSKEDGRSTDQPSPKRQETFTEICQMAGHRIVGAVSRIAGPAVFGPLALYGAALQINAASVLDNSDFGGRRTTTAE